MPTTNGHEVVTGCVLDNHFGWHNHARLINEVAIPFGFVLDDEGQAAVDRYDTGDPDQTDENDPEVVMDILREAEDWLNEHTTDGYLWHWSDGDFFLSPWCGGDDPDCDDDECAHWDGV
jgi:hypothetical protein